MAEPEAILAAVERFFQSEGVRPLAGRKALVTSGPTYEPIDPVRFIANRSSGKQGHAIAGALAGLGAETLLVSGPTALPDPLGVKTVHVETAREMLAACEDALPVDVAVCAAAVADWRPDHSANQKLKKSAGVKPAVALVENPDILTTLSTRKNDRPSLVVGFAAETENVIAHAQEKRARKGCDWIVANDVSPARGVMGGELNTVHLVTGETCESWPTMSKIAVAAKLARRIAAHFGGTRSCRCLAGRSAAHSSAGRAGCRAHRPFARLARRL
jgi:phosphopantothenoylcysteine decarboxylase/phosphopantothenate--cysteine ligase